MSDIFDMFGLDEAPKVRPEPPVTPTAPSPPPTPPRPDADESDNLPPRYARYLDCGHLNWYSDELNDAARAEGHCCAGGQKKRVISWTQLKGEYVRPLPKDARRTVEKDRAGGFPGYCCDDAGYYIGGIGNNCSAYSPDDRRCVVHRKPSKSKFSEEDEPVEVVEEEAPEEATPAPAPVPEPPMPKATVGSWKQRQMSAKRGRR